MVSKLKLFSNCCFAALLLFPAITLADLSVNGKSSQNYKPAVFSSKPTDAFIKESITKAKNAAWEKYTQGFSPSKMKSYRQIESSILKNIDEYLIEVDVIHKKTDKDAKLFTVVVRATINTAKFDAKLSEISNAGAMSSGSGSLFSFVFVARQEESIKSFAAKSTQIEMKEGNGYEKESASQQGDTALGSHEFKNVSKNTTGGSTTRKADHIEYRILSSDGVDTSMNQVLAAAGFEVVSYDDVVSECGGTEPSDIKSEFTENNEISRVSRKNAISGARDCEVSYFAVGTLDVGLSEIDPVTGNQRAFVSVKSQVWNIDKRLPRKIASVGPIQYQGLGPNAQVAETNALILAAKYAANEIVNQLNAKGLY